MHVDKLKGEMKMDLKAKVEGLKDKAEDALEKTTIDDKIKAEAEKVKDKVEEAAEDIKEKF